MDCVGELLQERHEKSLWHALTVHLSSIHKNFIDDWSEISEKNNFRGRKSAMFERILLTNFKVMFEKIERHVDVSAVFFFKSYNVQKNCFCFRIQFFVAERKGKDKF